MSNKNSKIPIHYHKLIRDRIPSIIKKNAHQPYYRNISGQELTEAANHKLLEEAYELFSEVRFGNQASVLKESADVLEILLSLLKQHSLSYEDLISELRNRRKARGGFDQGIFLKSVDGETAAPPCKDWPHFVFAHLEPGSLLELFKHEMEISEKAWIASAFYSPYVTNILTSEFEKFIQRGGQAKVILSTMGGLIKPEYLAHLRDFVPGLNLKVFHPPETPFELQPKKNFHVKSYIFKHWTGKGSAIIGSSNLSQGGFSDNIEWNYYTAGEINLPFEEESKSPWHRIVEEFEYLWDAECVPVTNDFIAAYKKRYKEPTKEEHTLFEPTAVYNPRDSSKLGYPAFHPGYERKHEQLNSSGIRPNAAQVEALEGLEELRSKKARAGVVIAATGVGKTYLAAFDFLQSKKDKFLFIAHRESILEKAKESFSNVLGSEGQEIFSGQNKAISHGEKGVFAMIQTLGRKPNLERFHPREFDYIVMDEFHHAMADTYRKVLEYFQPDFLLGLTATPERMDGRDVIHLCDYNIAYELRLFQAIDRELLAPFQYFAVYDPTDYSQIAWKRTDYDLEELTQALANDTRTTLIANNLKKFLPYNGKIKALAFCSSVEHARYTALQLSSKHDLESIALLGDTPQEVREKTISRLEDEDDPLKVICCVDIFNEGVDIPELSHVLMLRPTQSFTVFLQQLGRGLRNVQGKNFSKSLVVIDFIGNFRTAHVAPLALSGYTSIQEYAKDAKGRQGKKLGMNKPPKGCFVSSDLEVQSIWDHTLQEIVPMPRAEQLRALYNEVIQDLGLISPALCEFYSDPQKADPHAFIRHFGSWIKTKKAFEDLSNEEKGLLGTAGESFLEHLEKDLNPVKSYKMVVLKTIIGFKGTSWPVQDIAQGFLEYYLNHPEHLIDYDELAKQDHPDDFSLEKAASHILRMPLYYLSNKSTDWFVLDKEQNSFSLKPELSTFWQDGSYKKLVLDRADYALKRYFYRKTRQTKLNLTQNSLREKQFTLDRMFTLAVLNDKAPSIGESVDIQVRFEGTKHKARLKRSQDEKDYIVDFKENDSLAQVLNELAGKAPERSKKTLKIALVGNKIFDLRAIS